MNASPEMFSIGPLAAWVHTPQKKPRHRILLIHGMSEHSGRHMNTISFLVDLGYEVVRFDLRGSGQSGGERQWVEHWGDYVDDAARVFNWVCSTMPPLPLYVLGHSLGGTVAIYFSAKYASQIEGLMLSAPVHILGSSVSSLKITVGRVVERLMPHMRLPRNVDQGAISRDPEVVKAYINDPLGCAHNTLRQGKELIDAATHIPEQLHHLHMPVVLFHGSHDRLVKLEGSFQILEQLPAADKVLHVLPGVYHEPHNDLDKEDYFALLGQWLSKHTAHAKERIKGDPAPEHARTDARRTRRPRKEAE